MSGAVAETLLTETTAERRSVFSLYQLRAAAYRVAADCELMLDSVLPDHLVWHDAVGKALLASRQMKSQLDPSHDVDWSDAPRLTALLDTSKQRIIAAIDAILRLNATSAVEEALQSYARRAREAARELGQRAEPVVSSGTRRNSGQRPRVLVVDDEKLIRTVLARLLANLGCEVLLAESGEEAVEMLRAETVDLVLTDINMPGMGGIELLVSLKDAPETREIPVIVISSQDDASSVVRSIELGAEDHVSKPFEQVVLGARIRRAIERHDFMRRVGELTAAGEAVERQAYLPGSLTPAKDALGNLARVFDRMVSGLLLREERLRRRVRRLQVEVGDTGSSEQATVAQVSAESPFATGEILATRYEILARLGHGGMGMVYRARDMELGEEIALKVVRRDLVRRDPTLVDRLKSEIRIARKISHPNVVRAHDLGEWQGTYFITMEYVNGITVADLLDRRGKLTVESTLAIGTQLCEALVVAHEQRIIHRDIKPSNLLIDETGSLKVMDFGLARFVQPDLALTVDGFIVGTPQYMAPEQLLGGQPDERSDLFAVGVALYECLAGRPPFDGDTPVALATRITEGDMVPLDRVVPEVAPELAETIGLLLRANPAERVQSALDLARKLADAEHLGMELLELQAG
jgi:CheY-like chemotaxis protein